MIAHFLAQTVNSNYGRAFTAFLLVLVRTVWFCFPFLAIFVQQIAVQA